MLPANFIEICGTVVVPSCIHTAEGAPHVGVRVQLGTDENKIILATWGCQTLGATMPFSLLLDRNSLPEGAKPTLVASYGVGVNEEPNDLNLSMPLEIDQPEPNPPMVLRIPAQPGEQGQPPLSPAIIEMKNIIEIPEELLKRQALMTLGLYRTQEDGYSNRSSSYIAGATLWPTQAPLTLTTYLDGNTVNDDEPLLLRVAYYDPQTMTPYAGRTLRGLTLPSITELEPISLRPPRRS
ncbi:hypothetical protein [Pseudomonas sp. B14(2017)]|uniref:hypothetical protein n=1 Tax=Pseudomonas sp. B14(2017) TaxID=1981745 RepID=UPI000A1DE814|nr:hypothetical protein [Pseudomonas sp. B14(2017)]